MPKLFSLMWSHLFIFAFVSFASGDVSKKISYYKSKNILPGFSSRNFMGLGITFKPLIHLKFIFVHGVRESSSLILLHVVVRVSVGSFLVSLFH